MLRIILLLSLCSMLTACAQDRLLTIPATVAPPIEYRYLSIPAELLKSEACPHLADLKQPRESYGAAIDSWLKCAEAVDKLNGRLQAISELKPPAQ